MVGYRAILQHIWGAGQKWATLFHFHPEMPSRCPQVYVTRWKKYSRKRVGFLKTRHTRCWMPWRKLDAFKVKPGPDLSIKSIALINKKQPQVWKVSWTEIKCYYIVLWFQTSVVVQPLSSPNKFPTAFDNVIGTYKLSWSYKQHTLPDHEFDVSCNLGWCYCFHFYCMDLTYWRTK